MNFSKSFAYYSCLYGYFIQALFINYDWLTLDQKYIGLYKWDTQAHAEGYKNYLTKLLKPTWFFASLGIKVCKSQVIQYSKYTQSV